MTLTEKRFLEAYRCALLGDSVPWTEAITAAEWHTLLRLADIHAVYPMICQAVYASPAAHAGGFPEQAYTRAGKYTSGQTRASAAFLALYTRLAARGLRPIVMKGIVCRALYPEPEQRMSTDEDILIPEAQFAAYHEAFLQLGLRVADPKLDIQTAYEVPYCNDVVYIELHKSPFPPESKAYGDLNRLFDETEARKITETIYGVPVCTMAHTDHLLYLLCHAFKHFLNCGLGIRQVSDIVLFSLAYKDDIDWPYVLRRCREVNAGDFARAIYRMGEKHLLPAAFPPDLAETWNTSEIDETPLLQDILVGGVYGTSSKDRLHSSNITLNTLESAKTSRGTSAVLRTLFPSAAYMKRRYSYIKRLPILMPIGWAHRVFSYARDSVLHKRAGSDAMEAMRIGQQRVALMRRYRVLDEPPAREGFFKRLYHGSADTIFAPILRPLFMAVSSIELFAMNAVWRLRGERGPNKAEQALVRENVTFIVKSFERQIMLKGLCRNLCRMYPGVRIIVADDSRKPLRVMYPNVQVIHLPFNSGLSAGLEAALAQVQTPYVMRMDDDELLTLRSNVHRELRYLMAQPSLDLIGFGHTTAIRCRSPLRNFEEYYSQPMSDAPRTLKIPHMTRVDDNHIVLGKVANIYLARTNKMREVGFDPNIRMIDHHDFFWRAAGIMVSAIAMDTVVFHRHNPYDRKYQQYRSDYQSDLDYIQKKRKVIQKEIQYEKG